MVSYIKLGPIGDLFNSDILGIYLSEGTSTAVDSNILDNRLKSFISTGFLVEIDKVEHDNINLVFSNARNIPLNVIPITETVTVEPAEKVLSVPPAALFKSDRYLVWTNASGAWAGQKDKIAEYTGLTWEFSKPVDGLILPIYDWGISLKYKGTYPSGYWDYNEENIGDFSLLNTSQPGNDSYPLELFNQERLERIAADNAILDAISQLTFSGGASAASAISIADTSGYYDATNVELALYEIGVKLYNLGLNLSTITSTLTTLSSQVANLYLTTAVDSGIILDRTSPGVTKISLDLSAIIPLLSKEPEEIELGATMTPTVIDFNIADRELFFGKNPTVEVYQLSGDDKVYISTFTKTYNETTKLLTLDGLLGIDCVIVLKPR